MNACPIKSACYCGEPRATVIGLTVTLSTDVMQYAASWHCAKVAPVVADAFNKRGATSEEQRNALVHMVVARESIIESGTHEAACQYAGGHLIRCLPAPAAARRAAFGPGADP